MVTDPDPASWHQLSSTDAWARLQSTEHGLSQRDALDRLARYGPNALPAARPVSPLRRFLAQFHNSIIYLLLAAAIVTGVMGHWVDTLVILAVVLVNAVIGFLQEGKAAESLAALRAMLSAHARVLRDGQVITCDAVDLVPGDVVILEAGDRVPADLRLIEARSLLVDEAILTGESLASAKTTQASGPDTALGDRKGMAFSGSMVLAGYGRGLVVGTGSQTEIGRINTLLQDIDAVDTPLIRKINHFSQRFALFVIVAGLALFAYAMQTGRYAWHEALLLVVSLAVSVVPEGLPAVMTITLAIGVRRMAARKAIVRSLPAVETLGATSIICSDKTGTLTCNEMTVRHVMLGDAWYQVQGSGYAPDGVLQALSVGGPGDADAPAAVAAPVSADSGGAGLAHLLHAAVLCNTSDLRQGQDGWHVDGDPMEGALLTLARKAGMDPQALRRLWPGQDQIPFNPEHRFMASWHASTQGGGARIYIKGAPEQLLRQCRQQMAADGTAVPLDPAAWEQAIARSASRAERVLGYAVRFPAAGETGFQDGQPGEGMVFLGLTGFIDPPRPEAIEAVRQCMQAGITVKMITGDHALTAAAIARQLGLADDPAVLTGADLDGLDDAALDARVAVTQVFARTSPEHKLRIVRALQARGAVVAMTGDGVNDAPALRQADVGVAMGRKGTDAAKEASVIVLADDNFASIAAAVHEGRTVYDNIRKVIAWTLPTNGGELLILLLALLLGQVLPMTPAQILWVNLVTTATLGLVLAFEPTEPGVMARPPRPPGAPLLSPFLLWRVVFVSLLFLAGCYLAIGYAGWRGYDTDTMRTLVVNGIVILEIAYLFAVRFLHQRSLSWRGALGTPAVLAALAAIVVLQLAFTYLPFMQAGFATRSLALLDWAVLAGAGVLMFAVLEAEKWLATRLRLVAVD